MGRPERILHSRTLLSPQLIVAMTRPSALKVIEATPWTKPGSRCRTVPRRESISATEPSAPPTTSAALCGTNPTALTAPLRVTRKRETCRSVRASISRTVPSSSPKASTRPSPRSVSRGSAYRSLPGVANVRPSRREPARSQIRAVPSREDV